MSAVPKDDFFNSWSKPNAPKSSQPGTPRVSTPPILGRNPSPSQPTPTAPAAAAPPVHLLRLRLFARADLMQLPPVSIQAWT